MCVCECIIANSLTNLKRNKTKRKREERSEIRYGMDQKHRKLSVENCNEYEVTNERRVWNCVLRKA